MIERTLGILRDQIKKNIMVVPDSVGGVSALQRTKEAVKNGVPSIVNELAPFTFPLAARRYLDARDFLIEAGLEDAAGVMERQALLAGKAQYPATQGNWAGVALILEGFIDLEHQLMNALEACGS
ncbi:hypothetical protein BJX62DRAFT_217819 [Aspergillus germanicus]